MDCTFEKKYPKILNKNTFNKKDKIALVLWIYIFVTIIISIIIILLIKPQIYIPIISGLFLILLIILLVSPKFIIYMFSLFFTINIRTDNFLDKDKFFPKNKLFEKKFYEIKYEIIRLLNSNNNGNNFNLWSNSFGGENSKITEKISKNNKGWRLYSIKYGENFQKDTKKNFPTLFSILKSCPEVINCIVSVLEEKSKILIHNGPYKGVMRYMLPIIVPKDKDNVYLCNNYEKYIWTEGVGVLWDDTYPHKVFNNTNETRVVLFMDIERNNLPKILKKLNKISINFITKSKRLKNQLNKDERKIKI